MIIEKELCELALKCIQHTITHYTYLSYDIKEEKILFIRADDGKPSNYYFDAKEMIYKHTLGQGQHHELIGHLNDSFKEMVRNEKLELL